MATMHVTYTPCILRTKLQQKHHLQSKCGGPRFSSTTTVKEWRLIFEKQPFLKNSTDWYQVIPSDLDTKASTILKKQFKGSLYRALSKLFPETEWLPWKFKYENSPAGYWKEQSNQRKFFDDLGKQIGVKTLDDWYDKLSRKLLDDNGGTGLVLSAHKGSPIAALMAAYPEHNWIPWKFKTVPRGYWKDVVNQRKFFEDLGKELGVKELDDWYHKLSANLLEKNAMGLLRAFNDSPIAVISSVYPEHNWLPWKFQKCSQRFWKDPSNLKRFFDELGKQIGITTLDDWYEKLNDGLVAQHGGLAMITSGSCRDALMAAYPEHKWYPWKFNNLPIKIWKSGNNIKEYLAELSEKLSIQTLDDWYRVDWQTLRNFGAYTLLKHYTGLYHLLKEQYPHHPWDARRFNQTGKKAQRWLAVTLKKMFPNEEILEDYIYPKVTMSSSKRPLQLDVFIPLRSLAFEYQGKQHYEEVGVFSPTRTYQQRDEEKRTLCAANNIKLIEVPYWWNRTQQELQQIINNN